MLVLLTFVLMKGNLSITKVSSTSENLVNHDIIMVDKIAKQEPEQGELERDESYRQALQMLGPV